MYLMMYRNISCFWQGHSIITVQTVGSLDYDTIFGGTNVLRKFQISNHNLEEGKANVCKTRKRKGAHCNRVTKPVLRLDYLISETEAIVLLCLRDSRSRSSQNDFPWCAAPNLIKSWWSERKNVAEKQLN